MQFRVRLRGQHLPKRRHKCVDTLLRTEITNKQHPERCIHRALPSEALDLACLNGCRHDSATTANVQTIEQFAAVRYDPHAALPHDRAIEEIDCFCSRQGGEPAGAAETT